jgi:hypothetical protein
MVETLEEEDEKEEEKARPQQTPGTEFARYFKITLTHLFLSVTMFDPNM